MAAAPIYFVVVNQQAMMERRRRRQARLTNRHLRDTSNVFELPEKTFLKLFRLDKEATQFLIQTLSPNMEEGGRVTAIPTYLQILCALNFLGHGCYQLDTGTTCHFPMSQPSVSRFISKVCDLVNNVMLGRWVTFPTSEEVIRRNIQQFHGRYGFPGTIGSIDCTHVSIISPPRDHPIYPAGPYYNRKGFYSINVQLIVNAEGKILSVNARYPGSVHDSAVWQMSQINTHLRRNHLQGHLYYHLIGDEGYPLSPWLLTQYPGDVPANTPQGRYNINLRRARGIVERVNGILKGRFRCLLKHRTLNYDPIKAGKIINTCVVLHNVALQFNVAPPDDELLVFEEDLDNRRHHEEQAEGTFFVQGSRKRDLICQEYFV